MAQTTDFSVVNLILRKLEESRKMLAEGYIMRSLYALNHSLKLRIEHEFREENAELIDNKIHRIATEITNSESFKSSFGPVSFAQGDNETMYSFMNSLMTAEMEISQSSMENLLNLAEGHLESGKFDDARDAINSLLLSHPDNVDLRMNVGEKYLKKELYEDAELVFREAQGLNPSSLHVINRLGIAFRKMGRFDDAIAEYAKAIKIAPDDAHLYYNLAVALYSKKDYQKALRIIDRALGIQSSFPEGLELKEQIQRKLASS